MRRDQDARDLGSLYRLILHDGEIRALRKNLERKNLERRNLERRNLECNNLELQYSRTRKNLES